jgi:hypothetical protein
MRLSLVTWHWPRQLCVLDHGMHRSTLAPESPICSRSGADWFGRTSNWLGKVARTHTRVVTPSSSRTAFQAQSQWGQATWYDFTILYLIPSPCATVIYSHLQSLFWSLRDDNRPHRNCLLREEPVSKSPWDLFVTCRFFFTLCDTVTICWSWGNA